MVADLRRLPKVYVVSMSRIVADWLLEREIFFTPKKMKSAHRHIYIRSLQKCFG